MKAYVLASTFAVVSMLGAPASAQKTQDDPRRVEAIKLFQEGIKLHNNNMEEEALATYEKSYAIYPAPNTLVNIGLQEKILGRRLAALRHFREAMRSPLLAPQALELAKRYVAELEPSFARVDLKGPAGLVVTLDKEEFTLPLPEPLDVEPGTIMATGTMDGKRYDGSATVRAGQTTTIKLHGPPGMTLGQSQGKESEKNFWTPQHVTGVALGGAAVVAAGLGVGFLVMHNSKASDANGFADSVTQTPCNPNQPGACQNYKNAKDSANNAKTGSIVSFVAAGALAVGAVALLVPWQQWVTKEGSRVSARVVPTGQGILIDGVF